MKAVVKWVGNMGGLLRCCWENGDMRRGNRLKREVANIPLESIPLLDSPHVKNFN